jgi:aminoglycoside 2'-N-acetyltransferase I
LITGNGDVRIRQLGTAALTAAEVEAIRALLWAAFAEDEEGAFTEEDWQHSIGGMHFVLDVDGAIVSHASVVERELFVGGMPLRTGYVEAVATANDQQRRGYGTAVMNEVNEHIRRGFDLGGLGTGSQGFYERLGWQIWRGPSYVRTDTGLQRTPDEDGYILVLSTPSSPALDLDAPISCEWRPGDVW